MPRDQDSARRFPLGSRARIIAYWPGRVPMDAVGCEGTVLSHTAHGNVMVGVTLNGEERRLSCTPQMLRGLTRRDILNARKEGEMRACDRCGDEAHAYTTSMFNLDTICLPCKRNERDAPGYRRAQQAELEAVRRGDFNYPGVGLSVEDTAFLIQRRAEQRAP